METTGKPQASSPKPSTVNRLRLGLQGVQAGASGSSHPQASFFQPVLAARAFMLVKA